MDPIDIFCSGDDRHRMILLVDLLERAGQHVTLRCEPVAEPTDPFMVTCTRRAFRERWINGLFETPGALVALRLDDTPLPGPCAQIVEMQAWPARSADRNVASLVHWLQHRDRSRGDASGHRSEAPGAAAAGTLASARVRVRQGTPSVAGRLVPLGLLALLGALLWFTTREGGVAPPRQDIVDSADLPTRSAGARSPRPPADKARPAPGDSGLDPAAAAPLAVSSTTAAPRAVVPEAAPSGSARSTRGSAAATAPAAGAPMLADPEVAPPGTSGQGAEWADPLRAVGAEEPAAPDVIALVPVQLDALDHLCRAQSPAAARAWAATLNWKQRRRAPRESCVRRLAQRPGFEAVGRLLEVF